MSDSPDYIVEIGGQRTVGPDRAGWDKTASAQMAKELAHQAQGGKRPWIAIRWTCCHTYSRLYRNPQASAYEGACPKCTKRVRVSVGPGGTNTRFFDAI